MCEINKKNNVIKYNKELYKLVSGTEGVRAVHPRIPSVMKIFRIVLFNFNRLIQLRYQRFAIIHQLAFHSSHNTRKIFRQIVFLTRITRYIVQTNSTGWKNSWLINQQIEKSSRLFTSWIAGCFFRFRSQTT